MRVSHEYADFRSYDLFGRYVWSFYSAKEHGYFKIWIRGIGSWKLRGKRALAIARIAAEILFGWERAVARLKRIAGIAPNKEEK